MGTDVFGGRTGGENVKLEDEVPPRIRARRPPRRVVSTRQLVVPDVGASSRPVMLSIVDYWYPSGPRWDTCATRRDAMYDAAQGRAGPRWLVTG